mmetsp:Transcript_1300/g.1678  ORF Transcript_1300/g.1678 Transcript_1300/m.1678 type:complete len:186 (-) Transcript_1300:25-582(-)
MNMQVQSVDKIQPEHLRVVDVLLTAISSGITLSCHITADVWKESNINIFNHPLLAKDIPSCDIWRWNQTKSRKTLTLPTHDLTITLHKLIPRKRRQDITQTVPNHKLWYCVLRYSTSKPSMYILWCERGHTQTRTESTEETNSEDEVNVQDYSFLAEFMEPTQASQLWPETHSPESHSPGTNSPK